MSKIGSVYRFIYGSLMSKPTYFSWVVPDKLAASGRPMSEPEISWISKQGIKHILSLTEKSLPLDWLNRNGVENKHISMIDHSTPSFENLGKATQFINKNIASGYSVLIHCDAGKGRTGTIIVAYLVKHENMTVKQAIHYIRSKRKGSIEEKQESALYSLGLSK
jgi:atypical dual specificity phosphatase